MDNSSKNYYVISIVILAILMLIIPAIIAVSVKYSNKQEINVVNVQYFQDNNKSLYRVTTDSGDELILENEDLWLCGKTNSSDLGAQLQKISSENNGDCDITLTIIGRRVKFFSYYPNITKIRFN